jgi:hypothetical protein
MKDGYKLSLPNGKELSGNEACETVSAYRRTNSAVVDLYDLTNTGPHDECLQIDILALNALNAFGGRLPAAPMTHLWLARSKISEIVRPICKSDYDELEEDELAAQIPLIATALRGIDALPRIGSVTASKLLHRMRPGLVPIDDSRTFLFYRRNLPRRVAWETFLLPSKCKYIVNDNIFWIPSCLWFKVSV